MHAFEWIDAHSVDDAVRLLGEGGASRCVVAKAGGMDLLDLMKEGLVQPARVVNLRTIAGLDEIHVDERRGLHIGALATLAQIARHPQIRQHYGALAAAAEHAATPQVRNVATIGGNLLQRPRCWYFRNAHFQHAPDRTALAIDGENQYHAIFDNTRTAMVHASTPATALLAYDATVHLMGSNGRRIMPLKDFLLAPDATRPNDAVLKHDELLTHITLPHCSPNTRAAYYKQTERDSYDWPVCDVAVVLRVQAGVVETASIAMGWVAPTPRRATVGERLLVGRRVDEALAAEAAGAAIEGATPLSKNAYKVQVLQAVVRRTILAAAGESQRAWSVALL